MRGVIRLLCAAAAVAVLAGLFACGGEPEETEKQPVMELKSDKPKEIKAESVPVKVEKSTVVTIGTGGITGVYYHVGGAIANMINLKRDVYNVRATVESTGGSVFNVNAILAGDFQFGVVQSDRQFQAYNGFAEWANGGPQTKLRSVFSLHPESVTLVAAEDSGIRDLQDIRGKRVNVGDPGSGQRQNAIDAMEAAGIPLNEVTEVNGKAVDSSNMLQKGEIDAFFYTVGHPSQAIQEACAGQRKVRIVPIKGVETLYAKYPYYVPSLIASAVYPDAVDSGPDVPSFGVKATLVTSSDVPDAVVYAITREVIENLDEFRKLHPSLGGLTRKGMLQGLTAPIHPGAMKYYQEVELR